MAERATSYGVYVDSVIAGVALFALTGFLSWAWPGWWFIHVFFLGLPALWLVFIVPVRSRDSARLKMRDMVISRAPPGPGALVLDAGTGAGLMAAGYARAAEGVRVVAMGSFGRGFIWGNSPAHAMSNAELAGVAERVEFVRGSVADIPFGRGAFDLVVSSLVVHDIFGPERMGKAFEEMARVVKPGGRFVYVDFVVRSDQTRMIDGLGNLGLARREEFDVPMGARAWVFDKEVSPDRT